MQPGTKQVQQLPRATTLTPSRLQGRTPVLHLNQQWPSHQPLACLRRDLMAKERCAHVPCGCPRQFPSLHPQPALHWEGRLSKRTSGMPEYVALGCKHKCEVKSWHTDVPWVQSSPLRLGELMTELSDRVKQPVVLLAVLLPLASGARFVFSLHGRKFFPGKFSSDYLSEPLITSSNTQHFLAIYVSAPHSLQSN